MLSDRAGRFALGVLVLLAMVFGLAAPAVSAQGQLTVNLFEDPFVCNGAVRDLGSVSGFAAGDQVQFSSPELLGVFSNRVADANGSVVMRWSCSAPQTWHVTVASLSTGASASFTVTGGLAPPPPEAPIGSAFDAKSAMTAQEMAIWKDFSPFNTVGVYISVNSGWDNRADKAQSNLTAPWISTVIADGWRIIPIYVGRQAPKACQTASFHGLSADAATARNQGFEAAADAIVSVNGLGIGTGTPIYYDMEAYRPGCATAVLAFLDGWTEGLHASGYISGVYGSRASVMWDMSRSFGIAGFDAPDAVWVSTGNGNATSLGLQVPTDGLWSNSRIHQYRLSVVRTYGGVTREIDENIVNAPVVTSTGSSQPASPAPGPSTVDNDGDGFAEPSPDNCDTIANPDQADLDGDGDGDVCDSDIDGDGVANENDAAPRDPNVSNVEAPAAPAPAPEPTAAPTAEPTTGPAPAPASIDADGDGFAEPSPDNCDTIANPDQADLDGDGDGDVCDSDIDGDGATNDVDQAPSDPSIGAPAATAAPTPEPEPTPLAEVPTPTLEPNPSVAAIIVLPTPAGLQPLAQVEPTPTPPPIEPTPTDSLADAAFDGTDPADPDTSIELASEPVRITVQEDSTVPPLAVAGLSLFSLFCAGMGVRSYLRTRAPAGL